MCAGLLSLLRARVDRHATRPSEVIRRTSKKDFCDALYHLDQLTSEGSTPRRLEHRLALETILLAAYADRDAEERSAAGWYDGGEVAGAAGRGSVSTASDASG